MLRIAICDDNDRDLKKIRDALTGIEIKWDTDFDTTYFTSGDELCDDKQTNNYDVILLDILMEGIDGIDTAIRIRSLGDKSKIIFISSYDERLRELFDVGTIAFLDKPVDAIKLENALHRCYKSIREESTDIFTYKKNGVVFNLHYQDIIYFEIKEHYINIRTLKETIVYKDKLSNVWEQLKETKCFCMPNRSYVVNIKYISLSKSTITIELINECLNVGRKYKEETIRLYMDYLKESVVI